MCLDTTANLQVRICVNADRTFLDIFPSSLSDLTSGWNRCRILVLLLRFAGLKVDG